MDAATIARVIERLPALIQAAESLLAEPGKGADKLNAVLSAILVMLPPDKVQEFMQNTWPKIEAYVTILVEFYQSVGFFKSRKATRKEMLK